MLRMQLWTMLLLIEAFILVTLTSKTVLTQTPDNATSPQTSAFTAAVVPTTVSVPVLVSTAAQGSQQSSVDPFSTSSSTSSLPTITTAQANNSSQSEHDEYEYAPYDGWFNNFAHPEWGAADTALLRLLPPAYSDGVYMPAGAKRPNPLAIAQAVFDGDTGHPSHNNKTAMLVFFGQQMVEEILDAQGTGCPPEYFNIEVPKNHPLFDPEGKGGRFIPLQRGRYDSRTGSSPNNPRQQLNEVTPYFDGTLMYGPGKAWTDGLRLFKDGLLAATNDSTDPAAIDRDRNFPAVNDIRLPYANPPPPRDHVLKPVRRFFKIGNPRGNENPFLLTFGILWFRYHNFRARQLKANHPDWSDEKLFNEARKWVIAVHSKIVYYDFLPAWLGKPLEPYTGYNPQIHPQVAHAFQSAAGRFGHTLVPPGVFRRDANCTFFNTTTATKFDGQRGLRTCNVYWNGQEAIRESDIDPILMGFASQIVEREDHIVTPDLHGHVFGTLDFSRRDLMAVNIQRGRDHGLTDYNTAREFFGLSRVERFEDINPALNDRSLTPDTLPLAIAKVKEVYNGSMDDVDIWPAGMLETTYNGPGPLFQAIIRNQFMRIRAADRFWFENYKYNKLFTEDDIEQINATTLRDVILAVTNIPPLKLQENVFFHNADDPCPQPLQLNPLEGHMEGCTRVESFDYFSGSEASYIVTLIFIIGSIFPFIGLLLLAAYYNKVRTEKQKSKLQVDKKRSLRVENRNKSFSAIEWLGHNKGSRAVIMNLDDSKKCITLMEGNRMARFIDLSKLESTAEVRLSISDDISMDLLMVSVPKDYDLVLRFENSQERQEFLHKLQTFVQSVGLRAGQPTTSTAKEMKKMAVTKSKRQQILEEFFANILEALKNDNRSSRASRRSTYGASDTSQYINCELTKGEFAEALDLTPDSTFVTNMFELVDKNKNGFVSFREFLDFFIIFKKGSADEKARLLFDMHDIDCDGLLSKTDFKMMLKSMLELARENFEDTKMNDLINRLFQEAGLQQKDNISFDDFQKIMRDYREDLNLISLEINFGDVKVDSRTGETATAARVRRTLRLENPRTKGATENGDARRYTMYELRTVESAEPVGQMQQFYYGLMHFFENYRREIFWVTLYTLVVFGIFIERAYYYSTERETSGLRGICGHGVSITRGAANVMMFVYSSMLVVMCRNMITYLRDTQLNRYIPFDAAISMHKYMGFLAGVFTLVHIIGHCFNMYHISSQTPPDLICLFRNYFHPTDATPKFTKWAWTTLTGRFISHNGMGLSLYDLKIILDLTKLLRWINMSKQLPHACTVVQGLTGMGLTVQFFLMYVFSIEYARRHTFRAFWILHMCYPIYFLQMIFHGAGRMIQAPFFYYFLLGPLLLYVIDVLMSVSRHKIEVAVIKAKLLPSDVTYLEISRPINFTYKSGQWVRIACPKRGSMEYHPFTISSAPHETNLTLHVRAVGPWTWAIRRLYDTRLLVDGGKLPQLYLDGPYGEGHQDWHRFDVSILIGGGIGVTPFSSILKDIAEKSKNGARMKCKKVYFLWVTRTQHGFEWMTDIIREVEEKDVRNFVTIHTFITQFKQKFDIRTTMLYICEKYFQKISDRSLFTGLTSMTHFGRPDFNQFFDMVKAQHNDTSVFGVFSCGPPPLTQSVDKACSRDNKYTDGVLFVHHHENI